MREQPTHEDFFFDTEGPSSFFFSLKDICWLQQLWSDVTPSGNFPHKPRRNTSNLTMYILGSRAARPSGSKMGVLKRDDERGNWR